MKKILVLSPHPDDESIGCGGSIRKHVVQGDNVHVMFLTSGERGGHGMSREKTKIVREMEAKNAAKILGYKSYEFWEVPNGKLKITQQNIQRFGDAVLKLKPDIIYVTHDKEMHPEHRAAAGIVKKTISKILKLKIKPAVYMYEVWTPLQKMDHIVDITKYIDKKIKAIQAHKSQCAVMSFDEAIIGLNRYRGEMHSWPGGEYAEIFQLMKY